MNNTIKVAILDSGAGGLSIAHEIINQRLNADVLCVADQEKYPYGLMQDADLLARMNVLTEKCIEKFAPDIFIIACNTASTLTLNALRSQWSTPFIGVVPAIKPAAENTKTNVIGVLATEATISRQYLDDLIEEFAPDKTVTRYGSTNMVQLVENWLFTGKVDDKKLKGELNQLIAINSNIDQLVLACTHFPLLKEHIDILLKPCGITTIDSTKAIVNRLITLQPTLSVKNVTRSNSCKIVSTASHQISHYVRFLKGLSSNISTEIKF